MKNLGQCMDAYLAASALQNEKMPFRTAWALASCAAQLRDEARFFSEQERALAKKYAKKDEAGGIKWTGAGTFALENTADAAAFEKEHAQLCAVEAAQKYVMPATAPAPDQITPAQLEALRGFLCFEAEGKIYG